MIPPSLPSPTALPGLPPDGSGPARGASAGFDAILAALAAALSAPAAAGLPLPSPQPEAGLEPELPREAAPASESCCAPPPGAELPAVEAFAAEAATGAAPPGVRAETAAASGAAFLPSAAPAPSVAAAVTANVPVAAAGSSVAAPPAAPQGAAGVDGAGRSSPPSVPPAAVETETRPQAEAARQMASRAPTPGAHTVAPPPERPGPARSEGSRPARSEVSRPARSEGVQAAPGEGAQREPAAGVVSAGAAAAVQVAAGRVMQAPAERAEPDTRELKAEAQAAAGAGETPRTAAARGEAGPWQEPRADVGPQPHPQPQSQPPLDLELATVGAPALALHAAGTGPSAPAAANPPVVSLQAPERVIPDRAVLLAEQGGGSARLQLRPPELGEVELVVRVRGRRVEVHVRAEEIAAQQAVLEGRERLGDALAAKDLRMEEFRVSLSGGGSGDASASERRGERGAFEAQPEPGWARAPGAHVDPDETPRTARLANASARGIDLRV